MTSTANTVNVTEGRCLRPGCGRKLTDPKSVALGLGPRCAAKIRAAGKTANLSAWTPAQIAEAGQAIEDGAVVPSSREGVFHVVSSDGSEVHRTAARGCNCQNGLQTRPPRPCWHCCAVVIVLASQAPSAVKPAAPVLDIPAAPADVWAALEAVGALDLVPAF